MEKIIDAAIWVIGIIAMIALGIFSEVEAGKKKMTFSVASFLIVCGCAVLLLIFKMMEGFAFLIVFWVVYGISNFLFLNNRKYFKKSKS